MRLINYKVCTLLITTLVVMSMYVLNVILEFHPTTYSGVRFRKLHEVKDAEILIVGAGLSGSVLAQLHAKYLGKRVLVLESRDHIGGDCYDFVNDHGIRVSKYGMHIFHTNNEFVWSYVSQFSKWIPYEHRLVAEVHQSLVPIPANIDTINELFNVSITNPNEMRQWLREQRDSNQTDSNQRESNQRYSNQRDSNQRDSNQPMRRGKTERQNGGHILFDDVIEDYKSLQRESLESVLQRIHVRESFDDRYFSGYKYQALPGDGYTGLISQMLNHSLISVVLNADFLQLRQRGIISTRNFSRTFYTGSIDSYFSSSGLKKLAYRYIRFKTMDLQQTLYQPNVAVIYSKTPDNIMQIVEYKHLHNKGSTWTTIVKEYSAKSGHPHHPILNDDNSKEFVKYNRLANEEEKTKNVHFVGRLANYKYLDMDEAVLNAFTKFKGVYTDTLVPEVKTFPISLSQKISIVRDEGKQPSISFIISHCKESLYWIYKYIVTFCNSYKTTVFIYEKCNYKYQGFKLTSLFPECNIHQIVLPNVGREGHSWLYHMMTQQLLFSDLNIFLQGEMEVQISALTRKIEQMKGVKEFNAPYYVTKDSRDLSGHYTTLGAKACYDLFEPMMGWSPDVIMTRMCDYFYMVTKTRRNCLRVVVDFRAEFIVTDVLIRRVMAKFRKVMLGWFNDLSYSGNPFEGHLIERMWNVLFNHPNICSC